MNSTAISIKDLTKIYKGELGEKDMLGLDNLNLEVKNGEVFAFIGPNGAGKTTTIKLMLRLIFPTRGSIAFFGNLNSSVESMQKVGFLPEQPRMYEYLSGREFLNYIGRIFKLGKSESESRSKKLLATVGLEAKGNTLIRGYSRGMMQRLGLAQSLINDPDLLILDEPMASLDPLGRKDFRDLILQLKEEGKTIFFSSHILSDAEMIADRIGILNSGKLIKVADLDSLTNQQESRVEVTIRIDPEKRQQIGLDIEELAVQGTKYTFLLNSNKEVMPLLNKVALLEGEIVSILPQKMSLEELFIEELGRA